MDARQRWKALQSRLTAARTYLERGDRVRALAEVDAALAIDPSFLAATALRERIVASAAQGSGNRSAVEPRKNPEPATVHPRPDRVDRVFPETYAKFEQRARRRRVDRRIDAAKQAIAQRNLRAAAAALDEVIELDPNLPELSELTATFDELRRARATSHRGPTIAAAAAFGVVLLGASWIHDGRLLLSHPFGTIAHLVDTPSPDPFDLPGAETPRVPDAEEPVATTGRRELPPPPVADGPALTATDAPAAPPPQELPGTPTTSALSVAPAASLSAAAAAPAPVAIAVGPAGAPAPTPALASAPAPVDVPKPSIPPPSRTENDEAQITGALQQYRSAYEGLDAKRAQAVWPAVNEAALARAFGSLQSQTLTFDSCRTQLHGDDAVATCRGTARYVPKIGSRDPRVEPRTWTFVLRKRGTDWKIESARAER